MPTNVPHVNKHAPMWQPHANIAPPTPFPRWFYLEIKWIQVFFPAWRPNCTEQFHAFCRKIFRCKPILWSIVEFDMFKKIKNLTISLREMLARFFFNLFAVSYKFFFVWQWKSANSSTSSFFMLFSLLKWDDLSLISWKAPFEKSSPSKSAWSSLRIF